MLNQPQHGFAHNEKFWHILRRNILLLIAWNGASLTFFAKETVSFLSAKKASKLTPIEAKKYFIKIHPASCGLGCGAMDENWQQVAKELPPRTVWSLECSRQPKLCHLLLGPRLSLLEAKQELEFVVVSGWINTPQCAVEHYYGEFNATDLVFWLREANARDIVPTPASEIRATPFLTKGRPQLAILVLATEGLVRTDVWCPYLKQGRSSIGGSPLIRMFIHDKSLSGGPVCRGVIRVPPVATQRSTVSLVRASIQLLRHAMASGGADSYVFVSGDSIPLFSPRDLVSAARQHGEYTLFQSHQQQDWETDVRFAQLRRDANLPLKRQQFHKVGQWFLLSEDAAKFFANETNDYTRVFELVQIPDEHYFVSLSEYFGLPWREGPFMWVSWPKKKSECPNKLKEVTEATRVGGHLFARKVTPSTKIHLDVMSDNASIRRSHVAEEL